MSSTERDMGPAGEAGVDTEEEGFGSVEEELGSTPVRIHISRSAVENIREMIDDAALGEEGGLRLAARLGAGCSAPVGHRMVLEEAPEPDDTVLESGGIRLFLDPESAWILDGLLVDYVTSSPMGEGFVFRHPRGGSCPSC